MNRNINFEANIEKLVWYDNKIHILVFLSGQCTNVDKITYNLEHYYGNRPNRYKIDFVHIPTLLSEFVDINLIDTLSYNILNNRYAYFYIINQSRKIRQQLRNLFLQKTGINISICLYSKIVVANRINDMRKI